MIAAGVDRIGSVIVSEENREIPEIREAVRATAEKGASSTLIPLFSRPDSVYRCLDYYRPHTVHFCESLSDRGGMRDICRELVKLQEEVKKRFPHIEIMRSVPVAETGRASRVPTLEIASFFEPVSDLFLTDTLVVEQNGDEKPQPVDGFVGITGTTCDWEMAARLVEKSNIPVIIAGGLSPDNVFDCIMKTRPFGVDSCTLTNACDREGRPVRFKKDMDKVRRFVEETRRAEKTQGIG